MLVPVRVSFQYHGVMRGGAPTCNKVVPGFRVYIVRHTGKLSFDLVQRVFALQLVGDRNPVWVAVIIICVDVSKNIRILGLSCGGALHA